MSFDRDLAGRLRIPEAIPEALSQVRLTAVFTPAGVTEGRLEEALDTEFGLAGLVGNLGTLLAAGFLSRPPLAKAPAKAGLVQTAPNTLVIDIEGPGLHPNVIILLLRLIHSEYQTPPGARYEDLIEDFDGDEEAAREAFDPRAFVDIFASLTVEVAGLPGVPAAPFGIVHARRRGAHLPATGPLDPERIVSAAEIRFSGLAVAELDEDLEDAFLNLAIGDAFLPLGFSAEFEPGDEEIFITDGPGNRPMLIAQEVTMEQVFLFEFVACLNGGSLSKVNAEIRTE